MEPIVKMRRGHKVVKLKSDFRITYIPIVTRSRAGIEYKNYKKVLVRLN